MFIFVLSGLQVYKGTGFPLMAHYIKYMQGDPTCSWHTGESFIKEVYENVLMWRCQADPGEGVEHGGGR